MSHLQRIIVIIEVNIVVHQLVITTGEELTDLFEIPNGQTEINIENEFIRELTANMFLSQSNCQKLCLVGNAINSVHTHAFRGLTNLQFLSLRDNAIANFNYGTFDHVPKLEHMILSTNTFVTINKEMFKGNCSLMNLKYLDLSNNYRLHSIEDGAFSHLSNLVRLYLHDNSFFFLCPEMFQGLISLKEITFYYTMDDPYHMNMTGNTFIQLKKLTNLDFEGNNIRHLYHNTLHGLFNLKYLRLDNTFLNCIDNSSFEDLSSLEKLLLNNNKLTILG